MNTTKKSLLAILSLAAVSANAQWTATILHPNGYDRSGAGFADGTTIYGSADLNGISAAGILDNGSFTSFGPSGADSSGISAADGGHQYGVATFGVEHAGRWTNSAQSFEDWNPTNATSSYIYTAKDGRSGGYATFDGHQRATLWNGGGKDDLTDLHQDAWMHSAVDAIWGTVQYGDITLTPDSYHAGRWAGTAASWVDMNPLNAVGSQIIGTDGFTQSGFADFGTGRHATLWSGDAASAVDINPLGASESLALDVTGNNVSGFVGLNGTYHAGYWDASTHQFTDLHGFLVGDYEWSQAYGVQVLGNQVRVFGMVRPDIGDTYQAVMWTKVVPEPVSLLVFGLGLAVTGAARRRRQQ